MVFDLSVFDLSVFDLSAFDLSAFDLPIRSGTAIGAMAIGAGALLALTVHTVLGTSRPPRAASAFPERVRRVRSALVSAVGIAVFAAPPPATAPPKSIRDWLSEAGGTTSTASTNSRVSTPMTKSVPASTSSTRQPTAVTLAPPSPPKPAPRPAAPPVPAPQVAAAGRYRVRPGDCLWTIAARQLGPNATARAIDRAWRLVYATNHAAIGDNPGLIHPGTELALPPNALP